MAPVKIKWEEKDVWYEFWPLYSYLVMIPTFVYSLYGFRAEDMQNSVDNATDFPKQERVRKYVIL